MTKTALKRIELGERAPAVTIHARETGLWIQVAMTRDEAKVVAAKSVQNPRAKSSASRKVLVAIRDLMGQETRDRSEFIQADIPLKLKQALGKAAKSKKETVTKLMFLFLARWIDPNNGKIKMKKGSGGREVRVGPRNFRTYVAATEPLYQRASEEGALVRLQVQVGRRICRTLRGLLASSRIPIGHFLTALAADILDHEGVALEEVMGVDEPGKGRGEGR
jgi:hypothetical protein